MKKGLLQRASKNWEEEMKLANLPMDIKEEPILESVDLRKTVLQSESNKMTAYITDKSDKSDSENVPLTSAKQQQQQQQQQQQYQQHRKVQSMISVRKDYSYKYATNNKPNSSNTHNKNNNNISKEMLLSCLGILPSSSSSSSSSMLPNSASSILFMGANDFVSCSEQNQNNVVGSIRKESGLRKLSQHTINNNNNNNKGVIIKPHKKPTKRTIKPNISILERHDYDKSKVIKLEKLNSDSDDYVNKKCEDYCGELNSDCAMDVSNTSSIKKISEAESSLTASPTTTLPLLQNENLKNLTVPIERLNVEESHHKKASKSNSSSNITDSNKNINNSSSRKKEMSTKNSERDELKVIVAHEEEIESSPISQNIKQETANDDSSGSALRRQQTLSTESKDSQNINKINNKINIIFQLNDNTKRKNIILHRRTPKKMVQKITIKETNNNNPNSNNNILNNNSTKSQQLDDATLVPEKILCTIETQTEEVLLKKRFNLNMSMTNPLMDELTEYLFFENDVMISLQSNTISFFEFHRLNSLLKKGEPDFRLIDRISRRLHDIQVDSDNKFQRLCYNDYNSLPIYLEMRAKQKELNDPEMCPIAFLYSNIYYIDQKRAKFSSVHLDTVKSVVTDIKYTAVPKSSYFIMSWHEKSTDTKNNITGIVKYKLTPNLDLAKLASIRQFPKLNYQIKEMYCGKDSQLITLGDTQVSIFNYDNGDLLISWDLMKSYGINLATITFEENYLFMVYLSDGEDVYTKRLIVIGIHRHDSNSVKVIQTIPLKIGRYERIVSRSITSTNHLIASFSSGSSLMMYLENFRDIHFKHASNESALIASNDYMMTTSATNNVGLCHFTEFFLNN